jgi:hypothetical protein
VTAKLQEVECKLLTGKKLRCYVKNNKIKAHQERQRDWPCEARQPVYMTWCQFQPALSGKDEQSKVTASFFAQERGILFCLWKPLSEAYFFGGYIDIC